MTARLPLRLLLALLFAAACCMTGAFASHGAENSELLGFDAAKTTPPTVDRIRQVAQQGYDYAVQNPRVPGLDRMGLGKDAEIQATRWTRRLAERNGVDFGPGGLQFQVRGSNSVPDVVYNPATQIFDFKLTPKAFKPAQHRNFQSDFPGYGIDYIYGP